MVEHMDSNNTLFVYTLTVYKALSFTLFQLSSMRWLMLILVFGSLFSIKQERENLMTMLIFNRVFKKFLQLYAIINFKVKLKKILTLSLMPTL